MAYDVTLGHPALPRIGPYENKHEAETLAELLLGAKIVESELGERLDFLGRGSGHIPAVRYHPGCLKGIDADELLLEWAQSGQAQAYPDNCHDAVFRLSIDAICQFGWSEDVLFTVGIPAVDEAMIPYPRHHEYQEAVFKYKEELKKRAEAKSSYDARCIRLTELDPEYLRDVYGNRFADNVRVFSLLNILNREEWAFSRYIQDGLVERLVPEMVSVVLDDTARKWKAR